MGCLAGAVFEVERLQERNQREGLKTKDDRSIKPPGSPTHLIPQASGVKIPGFPDGPQSQGYERGRPWIHDCGRVPHDLHDLGGWVGCRLARAVVELAEGDASEPAIAIGCGMRPMTRGMR